jgi:general secretion pathway protein H
MRSPLDNGYTLIELLLVLGILGLIAAFAVPIAGQTIDGVMLQTDTRALVVGLRRLEANAVARQETISLTSSSGKLEASSGDALDLPDGGITRFSGATDRIDFFSDGTSNGGHVTVSHGDRSLEIEVAWLSGDVKLVDAP